MTNAQTNQKIAEALRNINGTKWVGNTTHPNIDFCLTAMNLQTMNSGHYRPKAVRVNGLKGIYMLNEDGILNPEMRIIKEDDNKYKIEYITLDGFNEFERNFNK
jgi:hypothetical protein